MPLQLHTKIIKPSLMVRHSLMYYSRTVGPEFSTPQDSNGLHLAIHKALK